MLELSGNTLMDFSAQEPPPVLLRFTTQGKRISLFAVVSSNVSLPTALFGPTERVIFLHDGGIHPEKPPIPNKHFYAVLQADGTHRFFTSDDPK